MSEDYEETEGYVDESVEEQLEDDALSPDEEGFLKGYEEADDIEKTVEEEDEEDE
jgi:hypothetical protein